jgi:hypothetical protein
MRTIRDTFPKKAPYRVVLAMPIEVEAMIKDTDENYETELLISLRILEEIKRRNESMITILSCEVQSPLQS